MFTLEGIRRGISMFNDPNPDTNWAERESERADMESISERRRNREAEMEEE